MTKMGADIVIILAASYNPREDGGYNLITNEGAIIPSFTTEEVTKNVIDISK